MENNVLVSKPDVSDQIKDKSIAEFTRHCLGGAEAVRKHLSVSISEEEFVRVAGASHADARACVIYGALDEVEKVATHLMRLDDVLSGEEVSPQADRISRNLITAVLEEVQARGRRLIELLVTLVLFTTTNDQEHFRHLLLIEDLVDRLRENQDFGDFHGERSVGLGRIIDSQIRRIIELQSTFPNLAQAWYAGNAIARLRAGSIPHANNLLSSARSRIQKALPVMTASEKISFGFTYGEGYGKPSETIHYSVRNNGWKIRQDTVMREVNRLGVLALDVLLRCYDILGSPEIPIVRDLDRAYKSNAYPLELMDKQMVGNVESGDFVLVYGVTFLGEVIEVKESQFGYRSFKIRFLAERPMFDVEEDWVPARDVRNLYTKEEMLRRLAAPQQNMPEEHRLIISEIFAGASPQQLQEAVRESLKEEWKASLRDWYHQGLYLHHSQDNDNQT